VLFAGHCYERLGAVKITAGCIHNMKWLVTKHGTVYSSDESWALDCLDIRTECHSAATSSLF